MESELAPDISNSSISTMLQSIKDCMVHLQDEVSGMAEMLEYLSANISQETR